MKIKSIYLGGAMGCFKDTPHLMKQWRTNATHLLNEYAKFRDIKLEIVNPIDYYNFDEVRHQSEKEIMDFDLWQVVHSDLVLVNLDRIHDSPGTIIELYEAKRSGIPVIGFGDDSSLHPWIRECINRIESNLDKATEYINEFYM